MEKYIPAFLLGFLVGAIFSGSVTSGFLNNWFRDQAIERGYALYCPTTGDFAWKGECDD